MIPEHDPALPAPALLQAQAEWLAPARSRLLRRAGVAHRGRTLDLGAGRGAVTGELVRRAGGPVVALDRAREALCPEAPFAGAYRVRGDALRLPHASASFDLVLSQFTLLWVASLEDAVAEVARVLAPRGVLLALEPDYGGLMEHPPGVAVRDLWLAGLARAGAHPCVGRRLPALLAAQGLRVRVRLLDRLEPPSPLRFELLQGLPLTDEERLSLREAEARAASLRGAWAQVAHLPVYLITAEAPSPRI
jgi:SAM-dependent methyltransferase